MTADRARTLPNAPHALLAGIAVAGAAAAWVVMGPTGPNVAWYLLAARRVGEGGILYRDIIDMNTPMIVLLSWFVTSWAAAAGVADGLAMRGAALLLTTTTVGLAIFLLKPLKLILRSFAALVIAYAAGLAFVLFTLLVLGEREQIMAVATLPYLIMAGLRIADRPVDLRLALAVGLLVGIGFGLKPHFLLIWLGAELSVIVLRRDFWLLVRLESLSVIAIQLVYYLIFLSLFPDYVAKIVPYTSAAYGAYDLSIPERLHHAAVVVAILAVVLQMTIPAASRSRGARAVLLVALLCALAGAAVQGKGWDYHYYPVFAYGVLLIALVVLDRAGISTSIGPVRIVGVAALVIGAASSGVKLYDQFVGHMWGLEAKLTPVIREHGSAQPVFVMASQVWPAFPSVLEAGAAWPYRFNSLWLLPAQYRAPGGDTGYRSRAEMGDIELFQFDSVVDDLGRSPPQLMIVDRNVRKDGFGERRFDYLEYFMLSDRFAKLWTDYRLLDSIEGYEIYVRDQRGTSLQQGRP